MASPPGPGQAPVTFPVRQERNFRRFLVAAVVFLSPAKSFYLSHAATIIQTIRSYYYLPSYKIITTKCIITAVANIDIGLAVFLPTRFLGWRPPSAERTRKIIDTKNPARYTTNRAYDDDGPLQNIVPPLVDALALWATTRTQRIYFVPVLRCRVGCSVLGSVGRRGTENHQNVPNESQKPKHEAARTERDPSVGGPRSATVARRTSVNLHWYFIL
jgi:hypothetical protein